MKKIFISFLLTLNLFGCEFATPRIAPYNVCHKDRVLDLAFEDALNFCCGSAVVAKGFMTEQDFIRENKKEMEAILNNPSYAIYVLLKANKVVGFIAFHKTREQSIEMLMKAIAAQGLPCDQEQLMAAMPQLKKTDAECKDYALIECLAVSRDCRGKGFGKMLLKDGIEKIKQHWPLLDQVRLTVNESNTVARQLYESNGFVPNQNQLPYLTMMSIVEYQRSIV